MRLTDPVGGSEFLQRWSNAYRAERIRRSWVSGAFKAVWAANALEIAIAAIKTGLARQWAAFAVLVALAAGFAGMMVVMAVLWKPDSGEIPIEAVKPMDKANLTWVSEPEDRSIPAEVRQTWWYQVVLVLWFAWAVFLTVSAAMLGWNQDWLGMAIALIAMVFGWLGVLLTTIGFVPFETPNLPQLHSHHGR